MADSAATSAAEVDADEEGLFSSSGWETFGRGGQAATVEHIGEEHRQTAKQSKWSPVTLWRHEA